MLMIIDLWRRLTAHVRKKNRSDEKERAAPHCGILHSPDFVPKRVYCRPTVRNRRILYNVLRGL
jgi:hypothetical protein